MGLIVGPVMAVAFFAIEPGGPFIDSAGPDDAAARVTALASNAGLARVAGLGVPLGLLLMLYGLSGINRVIRQDTTVAALSRFGVLGMTLGGFGWMLASGLNHVIAKTDLASESEMQVATALFQVDLGITIVSFMAVALGFLAFSLDVSTMSPRGFHKVAALVIAAVSAICLAALIIGQVGSNADMITLARACYLPWTVWSVMLGVAFLQDGELARTIEAGEPA